MKKNNHPDDWMKALRDKVDAAQTPSEHEAEAFEALMARMAGSAKPEKASMSQPRRNLRRVAAIAAVAAMLTGITWLIFRPIAKEDTSLKTIADNATVTDKSGSQDNLFPLPAEKESLSREDLALIGSLSDTDPHKERNNPLLAQASFTHNAGRTGDKEQNNTMDSSVLSPTPAGEETPAEDASSQTNSETNTGSNNEKSADSSDDSSRSAQTDRSATPSPSRHSALAMGRTAGHTNLLPSRSFRAEGMRFSITASSGNDNNITSVPTFAIPYASAEADAPLAAPAYRSGALPNLTNNLTPYDYEACTYVHHTPRRIKALAQCQLWSPLDDLDVSVGTGLMYTELTSTVYPLFINTTYLQRLLLVGIPIEADVSWMFGNRWSVFAGIGFTTEYCCLARLDIQNQPERPFHFGAYEQLGVGMQLTDELRLGVAAECSHAFTRTVLNTMRNTRPTVVGLNVSLSYCLQ